jgi:hypothetical protein
MDRYSAAILAVVHQPTPTVVFELVALGQLPRRVLGMIACHNHAARVPELD